MLVSQPGIEPAPPAVELWSLNHWTSGKSLYILLKMGNDGAACGK